MLLQLKYFFKLSSLFIFYTLRTKEDSLEFHYQREELIKKLPTGQGEPCFSCNKVNLMAQIWELKCFVNNTHVSLSMMKTLIAV